MENTYLAYRKSAASGASGFGLLIAMYDTLAGNLRRAAEAERANKLELRAREADHALLVIGHLEDWTRSGEDGPLAQELVRFYGSLRANLITAQAKRDARLLDAQVARVLEIRRQWQVLDAGAKQEAPQAMPAVAGNFNMAFVGQHEARQNRWSA